MYSYENLLGLKQESNKSHDNIPKKIESKYLAIFFLCFILNAIPGRRSVQTLSGAIIVHKSHYPATV